MGGHKTLSKWKTRKKLIELAIVPHVKIMVMVTNKQPTYREKLGQPIRVKSGHHSLLIVQSGHFIL